MCGLCVPRRRPPPSWRWSSPTRTDTGPSRAPARPWTRARPGWARPPPRRPWPCARPGCRAGSCAGCGPRAGPGGRPSRPIWTWGSAGCGRCGRPSRGRAGGRPYRPRPAQGRHRARAERLPARRLARARGRGPARRGRGAGPGHRALVPLRLRRRARPSLHPGPAHPLPRDAGVRGGAGRPPRGAAHRQLARHAHAPREPLRPRTDRDRDRTASRPAPSWAPRPTSGCAR